MIDGMTPRRKIAVTLPEQLVVTAQEAVAQGRAASVSAYVAEAMAERAKLDDLDELLEDLLARNGGPLTAKERRQIDEAAGWR
jgi:Arc/MetJ-type ribon-helix-helix transcriptional regulator